MSGSKGATQAKLRSEGRCRLCLRADAVRALTRHRVVPGRHGGTYRLDNVVPLCRPGPDLIDNLGRPADRRRYRRMLRAALWPAEFAYAKKRLREQFDVLYPPAPRELVMAARRGEAPIRTSVLPRHLRFCKASAGGCVPGCPVAAMRLPYAVQAVRPFA